MLNKTMWINFISSVEKPSNALLKSCGTINFNFQWIALENACLRVYVSMMDDYRLYLMMIEHTAYDYYFFLGK